RLSGSPGYYKAEKWGMAALNDAGASDVRLQECMVPHWVRGGRDTAWMVSKLEGKMAGKTQTGDARYKDVAGSRSAKIEGPLDILSLGTSVGTGAAGAQAPVVLIHDFDELERRKDEIRGKIVFYNYKFNPFLIESFKAYGDAVRYRVLGPSRAAKYGAVAVLVRTMGEGVDNNPHTGAMVYNDSFPKIPSAAVGLRNADLLAASLERGAQVTVFMRTMA